MPWFKLDCQFPLDDKIRNVTPVTRYSVICIFCYVKAFGSRGVAAADAQQIAAYSQMDPNDIAAALSLPIFQTDGKTVQVVNWQRYNDDPTVAERQRRHRANRNGSNGGNALPPLRNDVTLEERRGDENRGEEKEATPPPFAWNRKLAEDERQQDLTADEADLLAKWCEHIKKDPLNLSATHRTKIIQAIQSNLGPLSKAEIIQIIAKDQSKQPYLGVAITEYQKQNRSKTKLKPGDDRPICRVCRQAKGGKHTSQGFLCLDCAREMKE